MIKMDNVIQQRKEHTQTRAHTDTQSILSQCENPK